MAKQEILPAAVSQEFLPETLQNSAHYVGNDEFVQQVRETHAEIIALAETLEPWQAKVAEMSARKGTSLRELSRSLKKQQGMVSAFMNSIPGRTLYSYYKHLDLLVSGRNALMRQQMLERIAVENEKTNPNIALKALAEINRMSQDAKGRAGQTFNIVISNNVLQKGPLDI